ncbi:Six-hairpin glycosidase-like protein [Jimgerdemannia flammicorona]|uniref:Endoglucanase n=1 Tax=Jimgerdemannia flammicorona TaxID=994334 RepID=A0A433QQG3_9FUNG|nr:Six-hairpin glycosidase-like protein [Jimgerdemannia flammicorona]
MHVVGRVWVGGIQERDRGGRGWILPASFGFPFKSDFETLLHHMLNRSTLLLYISPPDRRHDSGLADGKDHGVDLVGGYYDAGDYLKFTLPLAHSLAVLSWGGIEFFQGYVLANQTAYLRDTVKWGTDWLIKAHPQDNVLYVQVGDGAVDNNYWGPDTNIPIPRPSYYVDSSNHGTDVVAETAAALASASILFSTYLNDTTYAATLLSHAKTLFTFAELTPRQSYVSAVSAAKSYYSTNAYGDELAFAALWLYRATNSSTYLQKASDYFDQYSLAGLSAPMDWSDQTGSVYVLGAKLDPSNAKYAREAERYLDNLVGFNSPCTKTTGGMLWCTGFSDLNSLVPVQDTSLLALLYAPLNSQKNESYTSFALSQLDYLLGNNPMLTPYVVGVHPNSPQNPHHAGAAGGTDVSDINGSPPTELHVLYGAVVGGPAQTDSFNDIRNDWAQTEVALDYNAPFQGLVAYQIMHTTQNPAYVAITQPRPSSPRTTSGMATWKVAVIVVVVLLVLIGVALAVFIVRRRRSKISRIMIIVKRVTFSVHVHRESVNTSFSGWRGLRTIID